MNTKRKMSYEQSLASQKGLDAIRANRRRAAALAATVPSLTDEQNAKWEADRKAALAAYRAKKAAR